jgi:hypothetical protein
MCAMGDSDGYPTTHTQRDVTQLRLKGLYMQIRAAVRLFVTHESINRHYVFRDKRMVCTDLTF